MKFSDLCNYYRECLKKDEVSVALKSGGGLFLCGNGGLDEEIPLTNELEHFVLQYGVDLNVGYPCYINNKGEYIPIFVFSAFVAARKLTINLHSATLNVKQLDIGNLLVEDADYSNVTDGENFGLSFNHLAQLLDGILKPVLWSNPRETSSKSGYILDKGILFGDTGFSNYTKGLSSELEQLSKGASLKSAATNTGEQTGILYAPHKPTVVMRSAPSRFMRPVIMLLVFCVALYMGLSGLYRLYTHRKFPHQS